MNEVSSKERDLEQHIARTERDYDELPYESRTFAQTHPARLAALAHIFGVSAPDVATARVLELGCASGGNIIPMAVHYPDMRILGIDLSSNQISDGQDRIARLGLTNIELKQGDITQLDAATGTFDYILCHGVYSWVPPLVQDAILNVIRQCLAPDGIAFVSFNVNPGWHLNQPIREAFSLMIPDDLDARTRVSTARSLLTFLKEHSPNKESYKLAIDETVDRLASLPDDYLFHEFMEFNNRPCTFTQFLDAIHTHELGYLCDCEVQLMLPETFGPKFVAEITARAADDVNTREQLIDVMTGRTFRQTLLIGKERVGEIDRRIGPDRIDALNFLVTSNLRLEEADGKTIAVDNENRKCELTGDASADAVRHLASSHAVTRTLDECSIGKTAAERKEVRDAFFRMLLGNMIDASILPLTAAAVSEFPRASALSRDDARSGSKLSSNMRHKALVLEDAQLQLLPHLDGTNSHLQLADILLQAAINGDVTFRKSGEPVTDPEQLRQAIPMLLPSMLASIEQLGLLEA